MEQGMNKISVDVLRGKFPEITDKELFIYHHVLDYQERTEYLKSGEMPKRGLRAHIIQDLEVLMSGGSFEGAPRGEEKEEESVISPEAEKSEQDRVAAGAGDSKGRGRKNRRKRRKKQG